MNTSQPTKEQPRGFTLLEVLLSIAIIAVIASFSIPVYQTFQVKNDLDIAANTVAQSMRRAELLSQAIQGDQSWGVKVQNGSIVVFTGTSYAARDSSYDELFDLPTSITPSGFDEVVYSRFLGEPTSTGTLTLTSTTGEVRTVSINAKGTVTY